MFMTLQVTMSVFELASAAGLTCDIDPALVAAIASMRSGKQEPGDPIKVSFDFLHVSGKV